MFTPLLYQFVSAEERPHHQRACERVKLCQPEPAEPQLILSTPTAHPSQQTITQRRCGCYLSFSALDLLRLAAAKPSSGGSVEEI